MKIENIKFKAKRRDNGEWVEGDLMKESYGARIIEHTSKADNWIAVDPSTICQFIGLKDRNGVEVYENDIVKAIDWEETTCNVEYKDYGFCLCNKRFRDGLLPLFIAADNCDIYVVGNKFDKEGVAYED